MKTPEAVHDQFERLYVENYADAVRSLTLAFGDRGLAEDAVQEAFVKAYLRWRTVSKMARPMGWVYVTAANRCRHAFRRDDRPIPSGAAVADHAGSVAVKVSIRAALATLPPRQRAALVLRYLVDLSVDDIAAAMKCRPGTVKAAIHTALGTLNVSMSEEDELG